MFNLTYHQRLTHLCLESLELRRLRADLILTYKILFGLTALSSEAFFRVNVNRNGMNLRGHTYQLIQVVSRKSVRNSFFSNRIVGIWNRLPLDPTNFASLNNFKQSLTNSILAPLCKVFLN